MISFKSGSSPGIVTLKDPIERGLKVYPPTKIAPKVFYVTLKDPIERGLKAFIL